MLLFLLRTKHVNLTKLVADHHLELFKMLNDIDQKLLSNYKDLFKTACSKGHLEFAKWLIHTFDIDIHLDCDYPFYYSCLNGHLSVAQWIYYLDKKIVFVDNLKYIFCRSCENGHIDVVKWLHQIFDIDIHALDEYAFRTACANNHTSIVDWLLTIDDKIDIGASNDYAFSVACINGHLEMAQRLIKLKPDTIVSVDNYVVFRKTCYYGHRHVAEWLISISDLLASETLDWNSLFSSVCSNNQYHMARWLKELKPMISINHNKFLSFVYAVEKNNRDMINWLFSLDSECVHSIEAFLTACRSGYIEIVEWLYTFDQRDDNIFQQAFVSATKEGHITILKWLWSKDKNISIHQNDEFCFRTACENGFYEIALWFYKIDPSIDYRAKNDYSFIRACKHHFKDIAIWLAQLCPDYYLKVDGWMIVEYRINNRLHIAMDSLEKDKFHDAITILGISDSTIVVSRECGICYESPSKIIKTECSHYFCLECLLKWYILKNATHKFPCAYCRQSFEWISCIAFPNSKIV